MALDCPHEFTGLEPDGCWYCAGIDGENFVFSTEFDCELHLCCLKKAIDEVGNSGEGLEVTIFAEEFKSLLEEIYG